MTLTIEVVNTGSKAGEVTLRIQSVVDGGIPVTEKTVTSSLIAIDGEVDVEVTLESFVNPTTGMYYLVFDDVTGELLYNGSSSGDSFNVKIASDRRRLWNADVDHRHSHRPHSCDGYCRTCRHATWKQQHG